MTRVTVINFLRCDVNKLKFTILFSLLYPVKYSCIVKVWQQVLDGLVDLINEDSIDLLDLSSALPNLESWSWAQLHLVCKSLWQFTFTDLNNGKKISNFIFSLINASLHYVIWGYRIFIHKVIELSSTNF